MKRKLFSILLVLLVSASPAFSNPQYFGPTVLHRSSVTTPDIWFSLNQRQNTSDSLTLPGYNSVRIDGDVTGAGVSITCNLGCSNGSLWVSGDTLTFTTDTYQDVILQGCKDYHVNVDSVSAGDSINIYLTPFSQ